LLWRWDRLLLARVCGFVPVCGFVRILIDWLIESKGKESIAHSTYTYIYIWSRFEINLLVFWLRWGYILTTTFCFIAYTRGTTPPCCATRARLGTCRGPGPRARTRAL